MNNTITEALADKMLRHCRGGYLGLAWEVFDAAGNPTPMKALHPGSWVVADNYYGYLFLRVTTDMSLIECTRVDET